ncbi:MAG: DUF4278 domain-containing protein [Moorea sp. SIO2B7]|nr:DUF4278 domain-containing protein [Moorena sp. SIO2B7]
MKLCYRGVGYEYNPPVVETAKGEFGGKYRGLDWRFRNLKKPPVLLPTANLTYRGVTYNKPGTVVKRTVEPETVLRVSTQEKARSLMMNHTRAIKKRQQSMLSRAVVAIGSPAKASEYWNRIQGKVHPTFRASYDRFGASMS